MSSFSPGGKARTSILPSPTKGIIIIIPSFISVLVCELCRFCRVKARNNERERERPNDPRHGYSFCTTVRWRNFKRTISIRALTRHIRLNHIRNIRIFLLLIVDSAAESSSSPVDDAEADFTSTDTGRFPLAQRHFWLLPAT